MIDWRNNIINVRNVYWFKQLPLHVTVVIFFIIPCNSPKVLTVNFTGLLPIAFRYFPMPVTIHNFLCLSCFKFCLFCLRWFSVCDNNVVIWNIFPIFTFLSKWRMTNTSQSLVCFCTSTITFDLLNWLLHRFLVKKFIQAEYTVCLITERKHNNTDFIFAYLPRVHYVVHEGLNDFEFIDWHTSKFFKQKHDASTAFLQAGNRKKICFKLLTN